MSSSISFLNLGLFSALPGQGLFGQAGSVVGDTLPDSAGMDAQYSLALEVALGQGSVAPGFRADNVVIARPQRGRGNLSSRFWGMVPTHLLSGSSSPWMEGAQLALGADGRETVVESGGWRMAGSNSSPKGSGNSPGKKAEELLVEAALLVKKLDRKNLKTLSESLQSLGKIARELGDAERKQIAEMMVKQLGEMFPGISWDIGDLSAPPPPGEIKVSLPGNPDEVAGRFGEEALRALKTLGVISDLPSGAETVQPGLEDVVATGLEVGGEDFALGAPTTPGVVAKRGEKEPDGESSAEVLKALAAVEAAKAKELMALVGEKLEASGDYGSWGDEYVEKLKDMDDVEMVKMADWLVGSLGQRKGTRSLALFPALGAAAKKLKDNTKKAEIALKIVAAGAGSGFGRVRTMATLTLKGIIGEMDLESLRAFIEEVKKEYKGGENGVPRKALEFAEIRSAKVGEGEDSAVQEVVRTDQKDVVPLPAAAEAGVPEVSPESGSPVTEPVEGGGAASATATATATATEAAARNDSEESPMAVGDGSEGEPAAVGGGSDREPAAVEAGRTTDVTPVAKLETWVWGKMRMEVPYWRGWRDEFLVSLNDLDDGEKKTLGDFLAEKLGDPEWRIRQAAVLVLESIVPALAEDGVRLGFAEQIAGKLEDGDGDIRYVAVRALGAIVPGLGDDQLKGKLAGQIAEWLGDWDKGGRHAVVYALEKIGRNLGQESLEALIGKIKKDYKDADNSAVQEVLGSLGKRLKARKSEGAQGATAVEAEQAGTPTGAPIPEVGQTDQKDTAPSPAAVEGFVAETGQTGQEGIAPALPSALPVADPKPSTEPVTTGSLGWIKEKISSGADFKAWENEFIAGLGGLSGEEKIRVADFAAAKLKESVASNVLYNAIRVLRTIVPGLKDKEKQGKFAGQIAEWLGDWDKDIRRAVVNALWAIVPGLGDDKLKGKLAGQIAEWLGDKDVRYAVVDALKKIGEKLGPESLEALIGKIEEDYKGADNSDVNSAVQEVLDSLRKSLKELELAAEQAVQVAIPGEAETGQTGQEGIAPPPPAAARNDSDREPAAVGDGSDREPAAACNDRGEETASPPAAEATEAVPEVAPTSHEGIASPPAAARNDRGEEIALPPAAAEAGVPEVVQTGQAETAPPPVAARDDRGEEIASPPAAARNDEESAAVAELIAWVEEKLAAKEMYWPWQDEFKGKIRDLDDGEKKILGDFFVARLGDENWTVRHVAVLALGDIVLGLKDGGVRRGFAEKIAEMLGDKNMLVRNAAVWALKEIGNTLGQESLEDLIRKIEKKEYKEEYKSDVEVVLSRLRSRLGSLKAAAAPARAEQSGFNPERRKFLVGSAAVLAGAGLLGSIFWAPSFVAKRLLLGKIDKGMRDGDPLKRVEAIFDLRNKFDSFSGEERFRLAKKVLGMLKDGNEGVRQVAAWFFSPQGPKGGVGGYLTKANAKKLSQSLEVNHPYPKEAEEARRWLEKLQ